jgi:DNA-binding NtrC family response regulator
MMVSDHDILGASILIVDDQESNVSLLEHMLSEAGYTRVASTMKPQEVCALHRKNRYDLILLDLQMPGMDVGPSKIAVDNEGKRIELDRAFHDRDFALVLADVCERVVGEPLMRRRVVRI